MNASSFLDQLLRTGLQQVQGLGRTPHLDKYAKGAAVGGVMGLLLGNRRGRKLGGSALKVGSVVALGALAWKAYQEWQAQQQAAGAAPVARPAPAEPPALPAPQAEARDRALLQALVAAAKSDGHVDTTERARIDEAMAAAGADETMRQWLQAELARPIDPAAIAATAHTPELATEIYLASVVITGEPTTMERAYLDALARELRLEAGLQRRLEAQAAAVA
jgi:uncharacterized membrane protein YebE (DUF533 family)